eukprot:2723535-Lingulodinium_polyedra.AAC.1
MPSVSQRSTFSEIIQIQARGSEFCSLSFYPAQGGVRPQDRRWEAVWADPCAARLSDSLLPWRSPCDGDFVHSGRDRGPQAGEQADQCHDPAGAHLVAELD